MFKCITVKKRVLAFQEKIVPLHVDKVIMITL
jgi:hypothetical protein